ncbi:glycosyltransferase [Frigoribacterium sp. ACAM 257]|uniref:glycosyltransferase n=1 Tax=Frigoribacterium sp. ACAM 257 TaxID=2508998 RepID=UPI00174A1979|nr:glycosyltransferase [Frigoribacterium sp. ACAM 257]
MRHTTSPDIVHVSSAHPWTDNRVHLREAAGAAAAGYRVRLIAVESDVTAPDTGVEVVTVPRRRRRARMVLSTLQVTWLACRSQARVVHLHDPELVWSVPLHRLLGRRVVFDAHEDLPDQVLGKDYLAGRRRRLLRTGLGLFARAVVRLAATADRVVAATETIEQTYPRHKTVLVRNFPRLRAGEESAAPASARRPVAVYVGALGAERGAAELLRLARSPELPHGWALEVAGTVSSPFIAQIEDEAARSASPLVFHGQLAPVATRDLLLTAPVGLVLFQPTAAHLNSLPTKMFEYMAAGQAVILSDFPLWRELLAPHDCATFVDPNDPQAAARAIARYASDPELLDRHGRNARAAAASIFSWESEERVLVGVYRDLLTPTPSPRTR